MPRFVVRISIALEVKQNAFAATMGNALRQTTIAATPFKNEQQF